MAIGDQSAEASALYDQFVAAGTCQAIITSFQHLCDSLDIHPTDEEWFYQTLKSKLTNWKANSLWTRLDKRFNHREYAGHKACATTRVLVIGAGPCGLRAAIECKLLGARVVVVEKRDRFSRNNVLHLWPFVIHDLKSLGAKVFYPKFCAGSIDHISIRQLQCVLMKICLLLGVEIYTNVGYEDLQEPSPEVSGEPGNAEQRGWRAKVSPPDHPVSCYDFDVLIGADGKRNTLQGFSRKEFRGKLAIAITANFINHQTTEEARVEEISGVAFIFNQKFFKDLKAETGIDLENIVYYKDDTHYFVMTAKKQSLLEKGVLLQDHRDTIKLLSRDNVDQQALQNYAREAADVSTNHKLPNLEFAHNHFGQPDIAMFDFTSLFAAENSSRAMERYGRKLLINIVGDSLLEPFWPTGSGCARGFLGSFDAAWAVKSWASGSMSPLQVLAERESVYMLLSQTTPESLSKSFNSYTINPITRYKHCNTQALKCIQVRQLYDTTEIINIDDLEPVEIPAKRARTYDIMVDQGRLLRWCNRKLALLPSHLRREVSDLSVSWKDGRLFCLLLHLYSPEEVSVDNLEELSDIERLTNAFNTAETKWHILPMLSPEDIVSSEVPDSLFMVSYISQFYSSLRDKHPAGAAPELLSPHKSKSSVSPSVAKISSLRKLGKIIGSGSKTSRRRKSSSGHKSPRNRPGSKDGDAKSPGGSKSPTHLLSPQTPTGRKLPKHSRKFRPDSVSPKHAPSEKQETQGKLGAEAFDVFKNNKADKKESKKEQKAPGNDNVRSRMREIRDAFSLKTKRQQKSIQPVPKKKTKGDWVAGKYEKLEQFDEKFQQLSKKMEPGNIGNTNPGKRGANLVSGFTSMFEQATPEPSPVVQRKPKNPDSDNASSLNALLNREPNPNEICYFCKKRIYLVERQSAEGKYFHRLCFRCYFCDIPLHIGSYTIHRTSLGHARFYCDQHVGRERSAAAAKRLSDLPDSRPSSSIMSDDVGGRAGDGQQKTRPMYERIEFENSVDLAEEETEELQTQHNLGTLSPTAEQNTWQGESDSESDSDMEVEEEDDEDDEEDIIPSIDDVLDKSSWRQRQRLHRKTSNSSGSTLTSVTTATSSSADLTHQRLSHSRSSTPPQSLHLLTTTTSSALPAANEKVPPSKPVSILKQPLNISSTSSNHIKPIDKPPSTAAVTATSQSSSLQEINRRKSNFFAQQSEAIRLDTKAVLDPHPSSKPAQSLSAVNISLGDTLQFKKGKRDLASEKADHTNAANQKSKSIESTNETAGDNVEDIVTSAGVSLSQQQNIPADTFTRRDKSQHSAAKTEVEDTETLAENEAEGHHHSNEGLVAAGVTIPTNFVTTRKPTRPLAMYVVDTAAAESSSDSDDTSQSSFTVSTPSDSELEKMSAVGTLRPDGKLTPTNPTAAGSTPADKTSPSDSEPFYTPVLKFTPKKGNSISIPLFNKRGGSANSQLSRKPAKKSKANNACLANFSNPSYEHVSLGSVYATRSSEGDGVTDSSVYETPEETVPSGVVRHSGVELDGSFQKMCLSDQLPLASEEEFTDESSETESSENSDSDYDMVSLPGPKKLTPEKIQSAAARQHKREETKRLRAAQEIQRHLQEVEVKTKALENDGVELEMSLRKQASPGTEFDGERNKELMQRWFDVIQKKSQLFRYESELMVRAKELELEDRHARLTNQMRAIMLKPESEKSYEETQEESRILEELIEVVEQRNELVNMLETERLKERKEDEQLRDVMMRKGFELSPLPYTQVTMKKGYKSRRSERLLSQ